MQKVETLLPSNFQFKFLKISTELLGCWSHRMVLYVGPVHAEILAWPAIWTTGLASYFGTTGCASYLNNWLSQLFEQLVEPAIWQTGWASYLNNWRGQIFEQLVEPGIEQLVGPYGWTTIWVGIYMHNWLYGGYLSALNFDWLIIWRSDLWIVI